MWLHVEQENMDMENSGLGNRLTSYIQVWFLGISGRACDVQFLQEIHVYTSCVHWINNPLAPLLDLSR